MLSILYLLMVLGSYDIDQINHRCYNARAEYWDRFPYPTHLPKMLACIDHQQVGKKVLDIGSGTGQVAAYLHNLGFEVTCLDPSSEMVKRCRQKGLSTIQTTFQAFSTKERYGTILAILSLIHIPKSEITGVLEKISELLEPSGLFILSLLAGETEGVEESHSGYPRFFSRYTPQMVRFLVENHFEELDFQEFSGGYLLFLFKKKTKTGTVH